MKPPPAVASHQPPTAEMKALRNKVQRLLHGRRSPAPDEVPPPQELPPRLEDRPPSRETVAIPDDSARMPDRPRVPAARLRPSTPVAKALEALDDDDDFAADPSSSSSSSGRSRRSGEPSTPSTLPRESRGVGIFTIERRRARVSGATREIVHSLLRTLEEAENEHETEFAIHSIGEFAFGVIEPVGMLERQDGLDEAGVFQKLIDCLGRYMGDIAVVGLVLSIFGGLRIDEGIGLRVGMMRMVENLTMALRLYIADARIVREAICALCGVTRLDDVRTRILSRCGVIEIVIECLRRHSDDEFIQTEGARFVAYASMHSETNKTDLAKNGGLSRVLSAAREFRESRELCMNASIGVRNVTFGRRDIVQVVLGLDGVDGLLEILRCHGRDWYITAKHVLAALFHMTGCEAGVGEVLRHEGWEAILVENGNRHANRVCIQALCLAVMGRVAAGGGALVARRLVRCGAVKMALVGMHRFVNRRTVLYFGSRLVRILLEHGGGMDDVRSFGGVDRLLDLLYCTVVTGPASPASEDRYSGYADDVFNEAA